MNYRDIQHRFANKLEGKNGRISAGNVRYEGRNYYSYSTVFGQWVDISKNVVVIFDGSTSTSSSKHKLYKGLFPDDVHVFPLDFECGWNNCNLVSSYNFNDEDFKEYHRMQMIDHYVCRIYDQIAAIKDGKKKGLENVSFEAWGYIEELCSLYKDTSIAKWIKWSCNQEWKKKPLEEKLKRKLARMLKDGERNVDVLTDALFGEGTFKKYWDYCARFRKSDDKRAKVEALCNRLGIRSPYEKWGGCNVLEHNMSADDIRNLTAKERVELHFESIAFKEYNAHEGERQKKYNKNFRNAYKWIVGHEPKKKSWGGRYEDEVGNNCVNKDSGVVYECSGTHCMYDSFDWHSTIVRFDYDDFRKSEDKDKWVADFYKKCEYAAMLRRAYDIFKRVNAHFEERSYSEKKFLDDDYLRENVSESEYEVCKKYIAAQDKHYADEDARRRAAEIERLRREEEERKEREYMEQVKQEQIQECVERGADGMRDLWRKHLASVYDAECTANSNGVDDDFFYFGGNVLLRLNLNKDKVETSKNIRIPVDTCKKMWKIVSKWHENPSCFKEMQIDTKGSGKYTISSYQNDILTAGCHKISYKEMERMYNEIVAAV